MLRSALPGLDFLRVQPRHHAAEVPAHLLHLAVHFVRADLVEDGPPRGVLVHPLLRVLARLDFGQDLPHLGAGLVGHDPRARAVVAMFGGVADNEIVAEIYRSISERLNLAGVS